MTLIRRRLFALAFVFGSIAFLPASTAMAINPCVSVEGVCTKIAPCGGICGRLAGKCACFFVDAQGAAEAAACEAASTTK